MAKLRKNPMYKNYSLSIVDGDSIVTYDVIDIVGNDVEYVDGFLPIADSRVLVDHSNGGLHYIFNLDVPAKIEAMNLRELRRSVAVKNIFSYDSEKPFDLFKFLPYLIIILLVFFK